MKFKTNNPEGTKTLAKKLAKDLIKSEKNRKHALIVSLEGELGSGKTTFVQGFAKAIGIESWIKSPTFILMREHVVPKTKNQMSNINRLYHIDCYRLIKPESLLDIGLKDILENARNIVFIEWGEKLKNLLPQDIIIIKFKHLSRNQREIKIL